jgi:hypothetical protein
MNSPTDKELTAALMSFVSAIDVTGCITENDGPVGDPEWLDLADAYLQACAALGREPIVQGNTE